MSFCRCWSHSPLDPQRDKVPAEYSISFWTEYTYAWISPLITLGSRQTLELDDIPEVPLSQSSRQTEQKLSELWEAEKAQKLTPSLVKVTIRAFLRHWLICVLNCTWFVAITCIQPYLITSLLEYISTGSTNAWGLTSGIGVALFLGAISFICTIVVNNAIYQLYLFGMAIRSALIAIIFKKCLVISNSAKSRFSVGETVTLMSVDVERVWMGCLLFIWMGMAPVFIVLAMGLLFLEMGISSIAVMIFLLLLTYYQELVSKWIGDTRAQLVKHTVERTKLTNEVLQGIRVVKLFAWERAILQRIQIVRSKELAFLRKYLILKVINTILPFLGPVVMTYLLFTIYVLTGGEMTVKQVYSALAILNIIRAPMAVFPVARAALEEAKKSFGRLQEFLLLPELAHTEEQEDVDRDRDRADVSDGGVEMKVSNPLNSVGSSVEVSIENDCLVSIENATFTWKEPFHEMSSDRNGQIKSSSSPLSSNSSERYEQVNARDKDKGENEDGDDGNDDGSSSGAILTGVNLKIRRGELVAVLGSVGSGKSSLLAAILQQIQRTRGQQRLSCSVAYVSQEHWIQNKTMQDNILFFSPMEEDKYMDVMDASQLSRDLLSLPDTDLTEIGERGINLSGGQKARANIARALYAPDVELYIFDDPLAAVDAHVSSALFTQAILEQLDGKARVVVFSSNYHFLPYFDRFLVVDGRGNVEVYSSHIELVSTHPQFKTSKHQKRDESGVAMDNCEGLGGEKKSTEAKAESKEEINMANKFPSLYRELQAKIKKKQCATGRLVLDEDRERGQVSIATISKYYSVIMGEKNGHWVFMGIVLAFVIAQGFRVLSDLWVGIWAQDAQTDHPKHSQGFYISMFSAFFVATCIFVVFRSAWFLYACLGASQIIHEQILRNVISAPINKWFDITPIGRILNRFTKDLDAVDAMLPDFLLQSLQQIFHIAAVVIICIVSTPYMAPVILPLAVAFYIIQNYFRKTSRELKRLDGITRSPIYNHFGEMLAGLSIIRAYKKQETFMDMHHKLCDINKKCFFAFNITSRWLSLRLDAISAFLILFLGVIAVLMTDSSYHVDSNLVGIGLVYSMQIIGMLQWAVRMVIETENSLTSVERLLAFNQIESETTGGLDEAKLPPNWPSDGAIEISNLKMRYRAGLPLVLNIEKLSIPGGCKVGVCGRTGAGKSSLVLALLRLVEPEAKSSIRIDGVDSCSVDLSVLRSKFTVIPQDPFMFSGSLRYNLDPFDTYSDEDIWQALERVHLKNDIIAKFPERLDYIVSDRGENVSVGQRQLLCIARALLKKSKIIIMDEASASVDTSTDQKLQHTLRNEFANCTVFTIAHRLETIVDYDMIVVMSAGEVVECGSPFALLNQEVGMFATLVNELGSDAKSHFLNIINRGIVR